MGIFDWLLGDYVKVKCPDGTPHRVLRKADKIKDLFFAAYNERNVSLKSEIESQLVMFKGTGEVNYKNTMKSMLDKSNKLQNNAAQKYVGAYSAYMSNPCNAYEFYQKEVTKINESYDMMTMSYMKLKHAKELHQKTGQPIEEKIVEVDDFDIDPNVHLKSYLDEDGVYKTGRKKSITIKDDPLSESLKLMDDALKKLEVPE